MIAFLGLLIFIVLLWIYIIYHIHYERRWNRVYSEALANTKDDTLPASGPFIAYKTALYYDEKKGLDYIAVIKLVVPKNAKRLQPIQSSRCEFNNKCRCDMAFVASIYAIDDGHAFNSIRSVFDKNFIYTVGKLSKAKRFNSDRTIECGRGIHFFMKEEDAIIFAKRMFLFLYNI